ncbi:metallophosphoesterase family protein [Krasilnikovia sp. MM14-A1259]|uniref:metallophosphoesterase family protein n=1 Tax=Krasilnikovia sp. MM14-A1259 TaxID=3373539 RepID=UPI0037F1A1ED
MFETVAVISDVHGVLPVLQAVLDHPEVRGADRIVVCGDHAAGPQPGEVLDLLTSLDNAVLVRGNADRELAVLGRKEALDGAYPIDVWAAAQLSPAQIDLLAGLPHPVTLDVRGFGPVVFCHGTPRSDEEVVLVDTRLEKWAEVFAELPDEVRTVVCGHTHMPYVRLVNRRTVVNAGSIGMPYGSTGGHWALLRDGEISLRRVEIDVDEAVARVVAGSSYPDRQAWADCYLRSEVSDADAVTAFGPRDGRGA